MPWYKNAECIASRTAVFPLKEKETLEFKKKAKLNIQTKTIEGNQHKLTIKNNGKNTATNVRLNILLHKEAKTKLFREMYSILPATIPSGNEITFKYRTMSQAHLKVFNAELMWDDEFQRDNKEKITISQWRWEKADIWYGGTVPPLSCILGFQSI